MYSILVVTAEPDTRPSTAQLELLIDGLRRQPEVRVTVWYLRDYQRLRKRGERSVDALRTWWVNQLLEAIGLTLPAAWLRGRRLRRWFRTVSPDVVIFDDGFGDRILSACGTRPLVVFRENRVPGEVFGFDESPIVEPDFVLTDRIVPAPTAEDTETNPVPRLQIPPPLDDAKESVAVGRAARAGGRGRLGVPEGVPLVVGWGDDGWVDGSDLFIRTLWFVQDRHGIAAHGVWLGPMGDHVEVDRLRSEAERCGLADRLHLREPGDPTDRWCGDVAFLPWRVELEPELAHMAGPCDQGIVVFAPAPVDLPWVHAVPFLDLPEAARHIAAELERTASWAVVADSGTFAARFLGLVQAMGPGQPR